MGKRRYTDTDYQNDICYFIADYNALIGDYYFNRDTLAYWGERTSEMKILKRKETIKDYKGVEHTCFVLSKISHNLNFGNGRTYEYFDVNTLEVIMES